MVARPPHTCLQVSSRWAPAGSPRPLPAVSRRGGAGAARGLRQEPLVSASFPLGFSEPASLGRFPPRPGPRAPLTRVFVPSTRRQRPRGTDTDVRGPQRLVGNRACGRVWKSLAGRQRGPRAVLLRPSDLTVFRAPGPAHLLPRRVGNMLRVPVPRRWSRFRNLPVRPGRDFSLPGNRQRAPPVPRAPKGRAPAQRGAQAAADSGHRLHSENPGPRAPDSGPGSSGRLGLDRAGALAGPGEVRTAAQGRPTRRYRGKFSAKGRWERPLRHSPLRPQICALRPRVSDRTARSVPGS